MIITYDSNSTSKVKTSGDYVVLGFKEYAQELHTEARSIFFFMEITSKTKSWFLLHRHVPIEAEI